mmetsp:Transcript_27589/g.20713  ORF Transcript_27589/g.20713 Transcript_27589/m.20713 type:complete len:138 (+) Transcript_27589:180-593(+)
MVLSETSNILSPFLCHFNHQSLLWFLFNCGVLYTIGNYHLLKHGASHFFTVYGAGMAMGSVFTLYQLQRDHDAKLSGAVSGSAALFGYNLFRNAHWFKFGLASMSWLALLMVYCVYAGDRAAFGGFSAGYLIFLLGL